jgi:hypothetical protein
MGVYKEGFYAIDAIEKASKQIYPDACDFGAPFKTGDKISMFAKQLVEDYADGDVPPAVIVTPKYAYKTVTVKLVNEGNGDTVYFNVTAHSFRPKLKVHGEEFNGFVSVEYLEDRTIKGDKYLDL